MTATQRVHHVARYQVDPSLNRAVEEARTVRVGAGVADVETYLTVARQGDDIVSPVGFGEINGRSMTLDWIFPLEFIGKGSKRSDAPRHEDEVQAFFRELSGEFRAGTFRCARDHCPRAILFFEIHFLTASLPE
jgi:hypothetical protein